MNVIQHTNQNEPPVYIGIDVDNDGVTAYIRLEDDERPTTFGGLTTEEIEFVHQQQFSLLAQQRDRIKTMIGTLSA